MDAKEPLQRASKETNAAAPEEVTRGEELNHLLTIQKQMMSSLSCGVLAYTFPQREILVVNEETRRIFGYDLNQDKPLIDTMTDRITAEDIDELRKAIVNLKNPGDTCTFILHPIQEDGRRITVSCITKRSQFSDGQQLILSVLNDVTKDEEHTRALNEMNRKQEQMLEEIRAERTRYRDALVADSEYSYRFDVTDNMVYTDFDYSTRGTLEENLGVRAPIAYNQLVDAWLKQMKPRFLTPKEQNPLTSEDVMACYRRGMKHIVTEYYNEAEKKYYRRTFLLSSDEKTGHLWAIAIIDDITEVIREDTRKRNELAMMNNNLQKQIHISQAFSSFYFASWELNLETGQMTAISVPDWVEQVHAVSGGSFEKVSEKIITSFVEAEYVEEMRRFVRLDTMAERLKDEHILDMEYRGAHFGWSTASLIPYMRDEEGNVTNVILALREISKEKRVEMEAKHALEQAYEAANRANAAKTDFLSSVSHDIRTPMNGIIGMTAIASAHLDDRERVADCLAKISLSSKHLLGLINEVLDMNKIESGKLDLNVEEFRLSDLMDALLVMAKPQAESKGQELLVDTRDIVHGNVVGDSLRIQQVFVNLLSNAVKYTPEGGRIAVSLSEKATNNPKIGCFEFVVEDNGIGMSKEFQEHIFEPFARAKDSRVDKIQGTGLGMSIARNIARMMNGDIQVESELSKGSRITVTLYLEIQDADHALYAENAGNFGVADLAKEHYEGKRALLAEDNDLNAEIAGELLGMTGMHIERASNGREAVDLVAGHPDGYFDIIFLDIQMPVMNGYEAARAIRELPGSCAKSVPIIAMTANAFAEDVQSAKSAGMNEHIAKPLNIVQLAKSLQRWLK